MIIRLKRKFIILATVSMFVLMSVLCGIMNIINYSVVVKESDATISMLTHSDIFTPNDETPPDAETDSGTPPNGEMPPDGKSDSATPPSGGTDSATPPDGKTEFDADILPDSTTPPGKPDSDKKNPLPNGMSPEVPYESRYFTVTVSESGEIIKSDFSKILSVDASSVSDYAEKALNSKSDKGFIKQFRFAKKTSGNETEIIFLDCGRKLDAFKAFLWVSIGVGFGGCVIMFAVFFLISGRIVKPIAESYEKQKRFVSDAGHEMKTPLTIINANLDLLESDEQSEDQSEDQAEELEDIRSQTKRMTELTNNLVYLSKMEETEHKPTMAEMPLSDVVSETVNAFKQPIKEKSLDFSAEITPDMTLFGSPDAIRRLTSVLIENAVKYSPVNGKLTVNLAASKKSAVLSVFNETETEIKKEDLPHVFDRFYRTDASRNSATGGHGIGLSIAKAVTEIHGGSIKAETESGKDFRVTVILPIK